MGFIRTLSLGSVRMGKLSDSHVPSRSWLRYARDKKPSMGRGLKAAWALFILLGIPLGFLAILGPLAFAGYYFEPLRQFWRPWPPDYMKAIIGIAGFAAVAAHLCYRSGRDHGYRSGKVAGKAAARNAADQSAPVQEELPVPLPEPPAVQATSVLPDAPVPPPPQ
jgi:hypothetical protein